MMLNIWICTKRSNPIILYYCNKQIIFGTPFCGKTSLASQLKERFGFSVLDYEKSSQLLKEKLGGEEGTLDELQFD